ncbi:MAG: LysR family transcriptional regulator [Deltaproteobacteria bacterium]|nr:LysR family transcriptional regulator [Deltaproteobacteria bacterium]
MTNDLFEKPDWRLLRYFSIIAEEASMRRAAERLFMTQPPLSRHMKRLEEMLGVTLFTRHSKGLTLTSQGQAVLRIVRPVLQAQDAAGKSLLALGQRTAKAGAPLAIGLSTAFEQGVFAGFVRHMQAQRHGPVQFVRHSSPQLARAVRQGRLDAALVALPLDAPGLRVSPLPYAEPLLAALPESWAAAWAEGNKKQNRQRIRLQDMNGRNLFWFRREANPAFFDHMRGLFAHVSFAPEYTEEPEEYDVLLARIAQAEGMGLLPRSFSAIGRQGVVFQPLEEDSLLQMRLGLILPASHEDRDTRWENAHSDDAPDQLQEVLTAAAGHLGG